MTREQKALAAYGSAVVVSVFLFFAWSRLGGVLLLALGVVAVTAALRVTHPKRSVIAARGAMGSQPGAPPAPQEEQRRLRAELQRRRDEATARTLGSDDPPVAGR